MSCTLSQSYEYFIALLEVIEEQNARLTETLTRQREEADKGLREIADFTQHTATLRQQVEDGRIAAEAAVIDLSSVRFNPAEANGTPLLRRAS